MSFYQTIISQLGGNRFAAMTGATNFVKCDIKKTLSFKVGRNGKKVTHVRIALNCMDLYDIEFLNIRGFNEPKVISKVSNVQAEILTEVFESQTGLYVSL